MAALAELVSSLILQQFLFRFAFVASILIHEWAHLFSAVVAAIICGGSNPPVRDILTLNNASANICLIHLFQLLVPFLPLSAGFNPHVIVPRIGSKHQRRRIYKIIECTGVLASAFAALLVTVMPSFGAPVIISFCITLALTLVSDAHLFSSSSTHKTSICIDQEMWEAPLWHFFCGNFGMIIACSEQDSGLSVFGVLKQMAKICMMRGAQSGGIGAIMERTSSNGKQAVSCFRSRVSAAKRDNLGLKLAKAFERDAKVSRLLKGSPVNPKNMDIGLFYGHTRFATSSIPLASETHPHQWSPAHAIKCTHWKISPDGIWTATPNALPGVSITHNGDFEFFELFGVERTFGQVQQWLTTVLDQPPPAACDSAGIAGVFEYLRTQGLWPQSLRLAYQQKIAATFDESLPHKRNTDSPGEADMEGAPACAPPRWHELAAAGELVSNAFATWIQSTQNATYDSSKNCFSAAERMRQSIDDAGGVSKLVEHLLIALKPLTTSNGSHAWLSRVEKSGSWEEFLVATIDNFIKNDLYASLKMFFKHARGSFGMAVVCELDPDRMVLAALNQTLSVTFCPGNRAVLYSSEPQVIMINTAESSGKSAATDFKSSNNWRPGHPTHRIDLDSGEGEAILLRFKKPNGTWDYPSGWCPFEEATRDADGDGEYPDYCRLEMHNLRCSKEVPKHQMVNSGRIVLLQDNVFVDFSPAAAKSFHRDAVAQDLADIPALLSAIHDSFVDSTAFNRATVDEFYIQLHALLESKANGTNFDPDKKPPFDLLITGVEVSLWAGEQFASDLQTMFPRLNVVAISANKVIGVIGNARGTVAPTGFDFTLGEGSLDPRHTMALCISHSGQTFPTMHATKILQAALPGRVFVLSGSYDTQMGLAVGHQLDASAPFCNRMFSTFAGWRGAEPPSVTVAAIHHCLTAILVHCADACNKTNPDYASLSVQEMYELQSILETFSTQTVGGILGVDDKGNPIESDVHDNLKKMGRIWSWHILEGVIAWIMAAAYIAGTVISGYPFFFGIARACNLDNRSAIYVLHALDAALYIWVWHLSCLLLRVLTGRPLLARFGKRTLVVADVPYVNQTLETFVSKLFSLSYGIASIDVHGTNTADHFVHRFTHRVARGVLIAAGRPDGRICSQTTTESAVLLALTQAHVIRSLGCPPEILTIGHNPYFNPTAQDYAVILPSNRYRFLCEALMAAEAPNLLEPSQRIAKIASMMEDCEHQLKRRNDADVYALSNVVNSWIAEDGDKAEYFVGVDGLRNPQIVCLAQAGAHRCGDPLTYLRVLGPIAASMIDEPDNAEDGMEIETIQDHLEGQSDVEQLVEARCLSLERLLAFEVMFHEMAARVASFWPLNFDLSRSQSGLRICTTAGPVSASDLVREYEETLDFYTRSKSFVEQEVSLRSLRSMTKSRNSFRSGTMLLSKMRSAMQN